MAKSQGLGRTIYRKYGTFIILIALIIIVGVAGDGFFTLRNLTNMLRTASVYIILGCGMTFVMLSGRIDLSVGSIMALVGCTVAICIQGGMAPLCAAVIGIVVGLICGLINGVCIAKFKVPFFIMTAGMMYAASGIALVATKETSIGIYDTGSGLQLNFWGAKTVGFVPSQFIITMIFFFVCLYILRMTKMGRYTYAIGSNQKTAQLSGVNTKFYTILIFAMNGLAAGIAGVVMASRLRMGSPTVGDGFEIDAIAAAAIGGTSMTGGEGRIAKTIVGAFILVVIETGLDIIGVSSSAQKIVIGVVLIVVVALDMIDKKTDN